MAASKSPPLSLSRGLGFSDFEGDGLIDGLENEEGADLGMETAGFDSSFSFGDTDLGSGLESFGDFNDLGGNSFGFENSRLIEFLGLVSTGDVTTVCSGFIPFSEFSRIFLIFSPSDSILSRLDLLSLNLSLDCLRGFSVDLLLLSLGRDREPGAAPILLSFSGDLSPGPAEDLGVDSTSMDSSFDSP